MNPPSLSKSWIGTSAVIVAVVIFGFAPPLARLAYNSGSNPVTLVELRYVIALVLLAAISGPRLLRWRATGFQAPIGTLGVIGLATALASGGYMASVELIPAGMASLLFYTFPIQVTVLASAMGQERMTIAKLVTGAVCLIGVALAIGVAPSLPNPLGVAVALSAAAGVAVLITLSAKTMQRVDQLVVQTSSALIATLCFTIWLVFSGGPAWPNDAVGWSALLGASASSAFANILFLFGVARIGPGRSALLANLEPITVLALAPWLLDEHLTLPQLAGASLVLVAITILPLVEARKAAS